MTTQTSQSTPRKTAAPPSANSGPIGGIVTVSDVRAAVQWYQRLGFRLDHRAPGADGNWEHARLSFGGSQLFLRSGDAPWDFRAALGLYVYVGDVDHLYGAVIAMGAREVSPVTEQPWGDRCFQAVDPFGATWTFATHVRDVKERDLVAAIADGH